MRSREGIPRESGRKYRHARAGLLASHGQLHGLVQDQFAIARVVWPVAMQIHQFNGIYPCIDPLLPHAGGTAALLRMSRRARVCTRSDLCHCGIYMFTTLGQSIDVNACCWLPPLSSNLLAGMMMANHPDRPELRAESPLLKRSCNSLTIPARHSRVKLSLLSPCSGSCCQGC